MDSKAYWVAFNLVKGIGAVRMRALLAYFGNAEAAWQASEEDLLHAGLPPMVVKNVVRLRQSQPVEKIWQRANDGKVKIVTWEDDDYPTRLKEIGNSPAVLYLRGAVTQEDNWAVAVVGTRRVTGYGRQVTEDLSAFLVQNHITVVSGLARGVDRIAHETALKMGGRTLAVLGSGVDQIYPPEHAGLAAQIAEHGAVISDYPLGTQPESTNFPPRNRLIAGLSLATVVVEAGNVSGSLITAAFAREQGREVFAVPGGIYAPLSKGTNQLINNGCAPLTDFEQILQALHLDKTKKQYEARMLIAADDLEEQLLQLLTNEPRHVDEISVMAGLPIQTVSATLSLMELKGMVRNLDGMTFSRN